MRHSDFIAQHRVPDAPHPALEFARRGEGRARSLAGQVRCTGGFLATEAGFDEARRLVAGLDVALAAVEELAGEPVHLHVVGPHETAQSRAPSERTTFHGRLDRAGLRELHRRCHSFVSPVTADGFPTAPAADSRLHCSASRGTGTAPTGCSAPASASA